MQYVHTSVFKMVFALMLVLGSLVVAQTAWASPAALLSGTSFQSGRVGFHSDLTVEVQNVGSAASSSDRVTLEVPDAYPPVTTNPAGVEGMMTVQVYAGSIFTGSLLDTSYLSITGGREIEVLVNSAFFNPGQVLSFHFTQGSEGRGSTAPLYAAESGELFRVVSSTMATSEPSYIEVPVLEGIINFPDVIPSSLSVGVQNTYELAFTTASTLPGDADIILTFPEAFDLSELDTVRSEGIADGSWNVDVDGQVVTLERRGGSDIGVDEIVDEIYLDTIGNPESAGQSDTYMMHIRSLTHALAAAEAVAGDLFDHTFDLDDSMPDEDDQVNNTGEGDDMTGQTQTDAVLTTVPTGPIGTPTAADFTPRGNFSQLSDAYVGRLIKTDSATTVYFYGEDHVRHPFPNEAVYFSYYESFDNIVVLSDEQMSQIQLGGRVIMRPGTHLVKIQSANDVYAVESGGVLRRITSEAEAIRAFGADWSDRVVDINVVFWFDYTVGEDMSSTWTAPTDPRLLNIPLVVETR